MVAAEGRGSAPARAALAGNPSDGYGGAVLAVTLPEFKAEAVARVAPGPSVSPASELVAATVRRFERHLAPEASCAAVRWSTSIPRGVGLGGSSAIVIATLRALCGLHGISVPADKLAAFALAVETEDLGIAAGLQDRVAQAYGGLVFMDFGSPPRYEQLDPSMLPPLLMAWLGDAAEDSSLPHGDLRTRFSRGDPALLRGLGALASAARNARKALLEGDAEAFRGSVDATFDTRRQMMTLDPRHIELVETARACGASANYTGSGGAIVAVCRDEGQRQAVDDALSALGCGRSSTSFLAPR